MANFLSNTPDAAGLPGFDREPADQPFFNAAH